METTQVHGDGKKRAALGKGIESLLGPARVPAAAPAEADRSGKPLEIALDKIERNPMQTRATFNEAALQELANSIKVNGVMQPVTVREIGGGRYQLIMGERRWRASEMAGKATIPAIVKQVNDEQAMEMTIVENLQREDLNPMEQARAFQQFEAVFKLNQDQIAIRVGKDRATVSNSMRLLKLPLTLQNFVELGKMSPGHAKVLLALEDSDRILAAGLKVGQLELSVRQTQAYVNGLLGRDVEEKPAVKAAVVVDPNVREAELRLQQKLGLKVTIEDRNGKGRVLIEYGGVEEFDHILSALGE
jgi:ParB family chromosome partitioning protein